MRVGVTPVPIPNTMVKTDAADNTWLETAREDRWLPDLIKDLIDQKCSRYRILFLKHGCTLKTSYKN